MGRVIFYTIPIFLQLLFYAGLIQAQDSTSIDLTEFSLEELMDVEVVSISRKAESIQGAAAAVFVISAEDIRRSGAHSIPEVLRLAPGLNVARINSSSWAITARGFNSRFANKLQVLVDGRSIYSPMFSGVYWEDSSVMLEDIERIEIIRGPGATMWGANAVNGVINIITRKPEAENPESMVALMVGNDDLFRGAGRIDGSQGSNGAWRLSGQYKKHHSFTSETGTDIHDAWDEKLARLRWDSQWGEGNSLTVSGHLFQGNMESQFLDNTPDPPYSKISNDEIDFMTASFQTIWSRTISETSALKLGLHFTHFDRREYLLDELHNIVDIDFQHNFNLSQSHAVIWGGTLRKYHDNLSGTPGVFFDPESIDGNVFSAFLQDDWTLVPQKLNLILGGKWEYRKDTGDQWQPNVRMAWTPTEKATWWASVARAVRVPSRINRDIQMDMAYMPPGSFFPGSPPISISMVGNENMVPEELVAYEAGVRLKPHGRLSLDVALFYNEYANLRTLEMGELEPHPVYGLPVMMLPFVMENGSGGHTQGGEFAMNWRSSSICRFQLAYSYWDYRGAEVSSEGQDNGMGRMATPKHQLSLRGIFNPINQWEADLWFRFTDRLMADPENVGDWKELDFRVSWLPVSHLRLVAGGRNLLHESHREFGYRSAAPTPAYLEPSVYVELQWSF